MIRFTLALLIPVIYIGGACATLFFMFRTDS